MQLERASESAPAKVEMRYRELRGTRKKKTVDDETARATRDHVGVNIGVGGDVGGGTFVEMARDVGVFRGGVGVGEKEIAATTDNIHSQALSATTLPRQPGPRSTHDTNAHNISPQYESSVSPSLSDDNMRTATAEAVPPYAPGLHERVQAGSGRVQSSPVQSSPVQQAPEFAEGVRSYPLLRSLRGAQAPSYFLNPLSFLVSVFVVIGVCVVISLYGGRERAKQFGRGE